jgi:hypothetical protein
MSGFFAEHTCGGRNAYESIHLVACQRFGYHPPLVGTRLPRRTKPRLPPRMLRLFYLLVLPAVTVALLGCAGSAHWLAGHPQSKVAGNDREPSAPAVAATDKGGSGAADGDSFEAPKHRLESAAGQATGGRNVAMQTEEDASRARLLKPQNLPAPATAAIDGEPVDSLVAEVRALGFEDPAEEASALAALRATREPAHRALLLRTMKAGLTMQRQPENREIDMASTTAAPFDLMMHSIAPQPETLAGMDASMQLARGDNAQSSGVGGAGYDRHVDPNAVVAIQLDRARNPGEVTDQGTPPGRDAGEKSVRRLHGAQTKAVAHSDRRTQANLARTNPARRRGAQRSRTNSQDRDWVDETAQDVARASHVEPTQSTANWQQEVNQAIAALEQELNDLADPSDRPGLEAKLRFLYLLAERREEALEPIEGVTPVEREFWTKEVYGLSALLEDAKQRNPKQRAAVAAEHLRQAADHLGQISGLAIKKLHFCTEVKGYGTFSPFPQDEFRLGQEVLLYCEVENFRSTLNDKGYHTALKARYEVFDSSGTRVAEKELGLKEEHCQNRRRDFFVPYFLWVPKQVPPGKYKLKLTIEDVHAGETAESTIEFGIKEK